MNTWAEGGRGVAHSEGRRRVPDGVGGSRGVKMQAKMGVKMEAKSGKSAKNEVFPYLFSILAVTRHIFH